MSFSERRKQIENLRKAGKELVFVKPTLCFTKEEEVEIFNVIGRESFASFLEKLTRLVIKGKINLEKLLRSKKP